MMKKRMERNLAYREDGGPLFRIHWRSAPRLAAACSTCRSICKQQGTIWSKKDPVSELEAGNGDLEPWAPVDHRNGSLMIQVQA